MVPRTRLPVDEWADQNRVIVGSAEPGPWRTDRVPYARGPMRAWYDESVDTIVCRWASQSGKTEMLFNCLGSDADQDPCWWMFVYPTEEDCRRLNKKRLIPSIRATPVLAGLLAGDRDDATTTEIRLGRTEVFFSWAKSDSKLKSQPAQKLAMDEIDEYGPGAEKLVEERVKAAGTPKKFKTSTPTDKGVGIDAAYENSDQRRFEIPCPHCGAYFEMLWRNVSWGVTDQNGTRTGSRCTPDEVDATAHVVCPACAGTIHDHHKPAMLRRGVWVREGERVEREGPATPGSAGEDQAEGQGLTGFADDVPLTNRHLGCPIPGNVRVVGTPSFPSRTAGFRLSSLYSPFAGSRFGIVARQFADAGFRMTPEFVRGWLGEAWEEKGQKVEEHALLARMIPVARGGYQIRTVPIWAMALTGGIDVQVDRVHLVVRAWGQRGLRSCLVDRLVLPSREGADLAELHAVVGNRYPRADGKLMPVLYWGIDSGDRTQEVYRFCVQHMTAPGRCIPTKGQPGSTRPIAFWWAPNDETSKGKPLPAGLLHINTDMIKTATLAAQRDPAAWMLPEDDGSWEAHDYAAQVTSEQRIEKTVTVSAGSAGRGARYVRGVKVEWVKRPGARDNHDFDAEVIARTLALAAKVTAMVAPEGSPQAAPWQSAATTDRSPAPTPTPTPTAAAPSTSQATTRVPRLRPMQRPSRYRLPGRPRR